MLTTVNTNKQKDYYFLFPGCNVVADVLFVVDTSGLTAEDYDNDIVVFMNRTLDYLSSELTNLQIGLIHYSNVTQIIVPLVCNMSI